MSADIVFELPLNFMVARMHHMSITSVHVELETDAACFIMEDSQVCLMQFAKSGLR